MRHDPPHGPMHSQPARVAAPGGLPWGSPPPTAVGPQAFSAPAPQSRHAGGARTIPSSSAPFAYPPGKARGMQGCFLEGQVNQLLPMDKFSKGLA